jgi:hypothetical protein
MANKKYTGAVFIDISKAFDLVWHDVLIYKLCQCSTSLAMPSVSSDSSSMAGKYRSWSIRRAVDSMMQT